MDSGMFRFSWWEMLVAALPVVAAIIGVWELLCWLIRHVRIAWM